MIGDCIQGGGECFADYAGVAVDIADSQSGEAGKAQIFVGVMGASNCIFAEATASRTLEGRLGSHELTDFSSSGKFQLCLIENDDLWVPFLRSGCQDSLHIRISARGLFR